VFALTHTLNPDKEKRKQAEEFLAKSSAKEQFIVALLKVIARSDVDNSVKLSAAVQAKNLITLNWIRTGDELRDKFDSKRYFGNTAKIVIPESDKVLIRENVVEVVALAPDLKIRKNLAVCVKHLCLEDFPERWTRVVQDALNLLATQDLGRVHAGLVVLNCLYKKYAFKSKPEQREPFNEVVARTLPVVQQLFEGLMSQNQTNPEAAMLIKLCCKIYLQAIMMGLPPTAAEPQRLQTWVKLSATVLLKSVPEGEQPGTPGADPKFGWWKAKRRAIEILERLITKYGFPKYCNDWPDFCALVTGPNGVAQQFILPAALQIFKMRFEMGQYVSDIVLCTSLVIIEHTMEFASMFKTIKPEIPFFLQQVLLPTLCWKEETLQEWETDPQQLVFDLFSFENVFASRGESFQRDAAYTLGSLCRLRKRYALPRTLEILSQVMSAYKQNPDNAQSALKMCGALRALSSLSGLLMEDKTVPHEQLLSEYVLPAFSSRFGFLRFDACDCMSKFVKVTLSSPQMEHAVADAMTSLVLDKELPVRVKASCALRKLLKNGTFAMHEVVRSKIEGIIRTLLAITREVAIDEVLSTLQAVIKRFPDSVLPLAVDICENISQTYLRYALEKNALEEEEGCETEMAAMDCMESIDLILSALCSGNDKERAVQVLSSLVRVLGPLINLVFVVGGTGGLNSNETDPLAQMAFVCGQTLFNGELPTVYIDMLESFETALHMIHLICFHTRSVPAQFWTLVPIFAYTIKALGSEYSEQMFSVIETMIQMDPQGFLRPGPNGISNVDIVFQMVGASIKECCDAAYEAQGQEENDDENDDEDFGFDQDMYQDDTILDKEAANAAYMFSTTLQSCSGQMDKYVKPIVDMMFTATDAPLENPWVFTNFLNVIESAIYYNPQLAVEALGPEKLGVFIQRCLEYLESHLVVSEKLICILAFVRLLTIPPSASPQQLNAERPNLIIAISELAKNLHKLREVIAKEKATLQEQAQKAAKDPMAAFKAAKAADDEYDIEDMGDENGPTDVPEEYNAWDLDNDPQTALTESERMAMFAQEEVDEDEEDEAEDLEATESPVDNIDEYVFLYSSLAQAHPDSRTAFETALGQVGLENSEAVTIIQQMLAEGQKRSG